MDGILEKSRMRRERRRRIKWYLLSFLGMSVIGGGLYGFRVAPFFQITELTVHAPEGESDESFLARMESLALSGKIRTFLGSGHFFAWPRTLEYEDPTVERVEIKKQLLTRTVAVNAVPRTPFGVWCFPGEMCFWIDAKDGILMREAPDVDGTLIVTINDLRDAPQNRQTPVLHKPLFENLKITVQGMRNLALAVKRITLDHVLQELHAKTFAGAEIRFSLRNAPTAETFASLKAVLSEIDLAKIEYVDMTVEKKVYVKNR